jgi:hypothetical protein
MTLPSPLAPLLLSVKKGLMDFKIVQNELERIMDKVEGLSSTSELPDKADHKWAEYFIHYAYGYDPDLDRGIFTDLKYDGG